MSLTFLPMTGERRLADRVAERILQGILDADLQPGDRLATEAELGRQFEVSRTVIREAVQSLHARGIVEARPGIGISIARVDPSAASASLRLVVRGARDLTYDRIHEVRRTIEVEIARFAALRATDDGIADLGRLHGEQVAAAQDIERAAQLDVQFHRTLAVLGRNELFVILMDSLADVMLQVRRQAMPTSDDRDHGFTEHAEILAAVSARDATAAVKAMTNHLRRSQERFRRGDRVVHGIAASPGRQSPESTPKAASRSRGV